MYAYFSSDSNNQVKIEKLFDTITKAKSAATRHLTQRGYKGVGVYLVGSNGCHDKSQPINVRTAAGGRWVKKLV